jgi:hypothetical protein
MNVVLCTICFSLRMPLVRNFLYMLNISYSLFLRGTANDESEVNCVPFMVAISNYSSRHCSERKSILDVKIE